MLTLVLLSAAIAKVTRSGLEWVLSDSLINTMVMHHYTHRPPTNLGLLVARYPWLGQVSAGVALVVEFSAPLLLVLPLRWRMVLLAAVVGMMLGFGLLLGVMFTEYVVLLLLFFVPWSRIAAHLCAAEPTVLVLYDGSCGLCRRTVGLIRVLDVLGHVRVHDVLNEWPQLVGVGLSQAACLQTMHVLDGTRVFTGFRGYRTLAWHLPLWWPVVPFLYLPGVPFVGERVYDHVAARRHLNGCPVPRSDPRGRRVTSSDVTSRCRGR
jgi:predicted DCC family thiol-disulfide oxidoreductase YuxK